MEKEMEIIMRYHCQDGYFVEVTHEKSALAGRDYWLCRRGDAKKVFMFSSNFKNSRTEEHLILQHFPDSMLRYEQSSAAERLA